MCFGICVCSFLHAHAQKVTVDASIDSLQILIGEQTKLKLEVSADANSKLQIPVFNDTIVSGVEVVEVSKADTQLLNKGSRMLISQEYTITSFDSALYFIPPIEVEAENEIFKSQPLALKVYSVPVDTLHPEAFFGPKEIRKISLNWSDIQSIVLSLLFGLILGGLEFYLYKRFRDNKPIIRRIKVEPKIPAHQQALQKIEEIKSNSNLRHSDLKGYYTELTDVLRNYMKDRFHFNAMEMTSTEIIERLKAEENQQFIEELKELFITADLVKFAKHLPLMNENDSNLVNAIDFIQGTKVEVDPTTKPEPTEITVVEHRSKRVHYTLLASLVVIAIAVFVCGFIIVKGIYFLYF